jgi:hypothetical protein
MKGNRRAFLAGASSLGVALAQQETPHGAAAPAAAATQAAFHVFAAALSPLSAERVKRVHMTTEEVPVCIQPGTVVAGWTFDGTSPALFSACGKAIRSSSH